MSTPSGELSVATPDVSNSTVVSGSNPADSSPAPQTVTDSNSSADVNTQSVQGSAPQTDDPLSGFPPDAELQAAIANKTPFAEMAARIKGAYEPLKSQFSELQTKYKPFEGVADRFSAPEEVQSLVDMREALLGWENDNGKLIPSTEKFIQQLDPQRAEFLFADLADGTTTDPRTGQQVPRMDRALQFIATDPERRANALRILGAVEPSAVAPQWQPTAEQLDAIPIDPANPTPKDKALQEVFRSLPYDEREKLAGNDPDYIRGALEKEQLLRQLTSDREQRTQRDTEAQQQREQMVQSEAQTAGDTYVRTQLETAMSTFHSSVVEQCRLIEPLDPQNPPQGMDAQQVAQYNQQAEATNKSEAATVTLAVVGLINEQTRPFVLPLLKEIGVVDDKFMQQLDQAGQAFGDNARNYGHLTYVQKIGRNGSYQPGADVTALNTESSRGLKLLTYYANQLSKRLIEAKGQAFGMKATGHNETLNGTARTRPSVQGGPYNPTNAAPQQPSGWMSRADIERIAG